MPWHSRVLLYLLPIPLWVIEFVMRLLIDKPEKAAEFFSPALASAAIGLIIPTTIPKTISTERLRQIFRLAYQPGYTIRSRLDETATGMGMNALLGALTVWAIALFASLGGRFPADIGWLNDHLVMAGLCAIVYVLAVVLTEVKERA